MELRFRFKPIMASYYVDNLQCSVYVDDNGVVNSYPLCSIELESSQSYASDSIVLATVTSSLYSIEYMQLREIILNGTEETTSFDLSCDIQGSMSVFGFRMLSVPISLREFEYKTPVFRLSSKGKVAGNESVYAHYESAEKNLSSTSTTSAFLEDFGYQKARYCIAFR